MQSLWSLKLDDLIHSEAPHPSVVKNHASIFRVGYQRGQLLLVVACEAVCMFLSPFFKNTDGDRRPKELR